MADSGIRVQPPTQCMRQTQKGKTMEPKISRATRTTVQELARQKADAERERAARLIAGQKATQQRGEIDVKPKDNGGAVVLAGKTDVALPDARTPRQAYLDEIATSGIVG